MEFYRLAHKNYADLSGLGGLYGSGRWHHKGLPVLYTASSRSLAALERFVHEAASTLPPLVMLTIWAPDNLSFQRVTEKKLPKGWDHLPDTYVSRDFGNKWLLKGKEAALEIPSAIVRNEYNILINPTHPECTGLKILEKTDFYYDPRLQKMIR
ncbi:RES family NAD+ phosphorylase [Kiloniella majae]|uniref:RES family NAD+ phosphorylase n=1 Tax=Kiloniella majae TaxID=1938558 RepID=UPI000A2771A5|nr:RES family NAD+ phosphorylase [Kiloniella majae]